MFHIKKIDINEPLPNIVFDLSFGGIDTPVNIKAKGFEYITSFLQNY